MTLEGVPPLCRIAATHLPLPYVTVSAPSRPKLLPLKTSRALQGSISDASRIDFSKKSGTGTETGTLLPVTATHCHP
jgi:hypothetical protein